MKVRRLVPSILATALGVLILGSAPALGAEVHLFSTTFGSFISPVGVAVNQATGHVYVADQNGGVWNFEASGAPDAVTPHLSSGSVSYPWGIAVDNSLQLSQGDIYVSSIYGNLAVVQFDPSGTETGLQINEASIPPADQGNGTFSPTGIAVDSLGNVLVADASNSVIDEFSSAGAFIKQFGAGVMPNPQFIATDGSDNLYVTSSSGTVEFDSLGGCVNSCTPIDAAGKTGVAVDGAGDVFVSEGNEIAEFNASGALLERFGGPTPSPAFGGLGGAFGIAVNDASSKVYVIEASFYTPGLIFNFLTVPDVTTSPATGVQARSATLNGTVNADGSTVGVCQFEWGVTEGSYPNVVPCTTPSLPLTGSSVVAASAELAAEPGVTYHYRLSATNENATIYGQEQVFTTPSVPPIVSEAFATQVSATAAKLHANIDPGGASTTMHFEYGTTTAYGQSTAESAAFPADNALHLAVAPLQGLQPETVYHYRVVATNLNSPAGGTPGSDETFTTQQAGKSFALPDDRAYELVSPLHKHGAEILTIDAGGKLLRFSVPTVASEDGKSVTYIAKAPIDTNVAGNAVGDQLFSVRGADGWSTQSIAVPHQSNPNVVYGFEEYLWFSSDLSHGILMPSITTTEPSLDPELHEDVVFPAEHGGLANDFYVRNNLTSTFKAVVTHEPLVLDVNFQGASPDLNHVVFGGPPGLDPRYPGVGNLYEWNAGKTQLVDVLPEGEVAGGKGTLATGSGSRFRSAPRHSVSDDGTHVLWFNSEGALFTRDMATEETVQVDAAHGGAGPGGGGAFVAASSDGTRVLFTDYNELTPGATGGGLFMFDVTDGTLTDLTPGNGNQAAPSVGVNDEATSTYEYSSAVLTNVANGQGQTAQPGVSNLYLLRETPVGSGSWSTTFITAGAEGGGAESGGEVRTSPDGRYLAFMSRQSVTGYDNRDTASGERDTEVYLYSAEANTLVCASCNATGARPHGEYDTSTGNLFNTNPMDPQGEWGGSWIASVIPGVNKAASYQPRSLSDSGRLIFDSADGLVPRDVNGHTDVYEYEPAGVGSCQPPSYGQSASVVFEGATGGCVGLISDGTRGSDSVFLDASANGNDVFFTTEDDLVPQDSDGLTDLYDARVCTQSEPCLQSPAVSPACVNPDSCRLASTPEPTVFGSSPTETFTGAGNAISTPSAPSTPETTTNKTAKCAKGKKLRHGRCVKSKKRAKKAKRAKRAGKNRRAKS